MHEAAWDALGTRFKITVWDPITPRAFADIWRDAQARTSAFDARYSRFKADSLVSTLRRKTGITEVPQDLTEMLALYGRLEEATDGALTPTIGGALEDAGYDPGYSLTPKVELRDTPRLKDAVRIVDTTHIELRTEVLLDLGALGKGYLVDRLYDTLLSRKLERFLIDGSGDIRYHATDGETITCGLEHPRNTSLAIGTLTIGTGSLCASATNRRSWKGFTHYIDPMTKSSPEDIIATWAYAETAALADGLSSALFFADPRSLKERFDFEYLVLDSALHAKSSPGFAAELFT